MGFTRFFKLFLGFLWMLGGLALPLTAQEQHLPLVDFSQNLPDRTFDFTSSVEFWVDSTGKIGLNGARNVPFAPIPKNHPWGEINLHNCTHNYWLRFRATGRPDRPEKPQRVFLIFGNHHFITLYSSINGKDWKTQLGGMAHGRTVGQNEYLALQNRASDTTLFYVCLTDRPKSEFALRAQLDTEHSYTIREALALHKNKWSIYFSLSALAIWGFVVLFALFQFAQNREKSYLYYALYVLSLALGLLKIQEYQWRMSVLFSYFPSAFVYSEAIAAAIPHITYRLFVAEITDLKQHLPKIARIFNWTIWFLVAYLVVDALLEIFFFREAYCIPLYLGVRVLLGIVSIYCIVQMFKIRTPVARMVMWGTVVLYAGVGLGLFFALSKGFSFQSSKINYIVASCTVEILIFSMALGLKSKLVAAERNRLEKDLLEAHSRIARDLHDDLGSALSSIALNSQLAANAQAEKMREALIRTGEEAREMSTKVRDLMWSIQPENDTIDSILSKMRQFSAPIFESQNIDYQFIVDPKLLAIPLSVSTRRHLYLSFKEAVNNLAKYANATQATIRIQQISNGKSLELEIQDNGQGFDPILVKRGHGLANLEARAALLNGRISIDSAPAQGTKICLSFPV